MNYWVISPNAYNNGKADDFLKLIESTKRVLMGWGEEESHGKTFKETIKIGDLILIAQGSNKNKKSYFCGLVDSPSSVSKLEEDSIIFESQSRLLKYFTKTHTILKTFDFDKCAYGASTQIPALYKLYPDSNECDKQLIDILEKQIMITKEKDLLEEKINLLTSRKQIILQGPPGTGKTRLAKQIAIKMIKKSLDVGTNDEIKNSLFSIGKEQVKLIQFHPSYSYEDFVRGIVATTTANSNDIKYETKNKVLAEIAKDAKGDLDKAENKDQAKKYILIIDEINRANLSSVLGELIYALEYRDEAVESMYEHPNYGREITLPSNLYIIGTMNTADRSIGHIDYAIRRRFAFESILPSSDVDNVDKDKFKEVEKIFDKHLSIEFEKTRVMLGHSYFIGNDDELKEKLKYQVIPLLEEYISDGVLADSKELREIIKNL